MAALYGSTTDIIVCYYPLWEYDGHVSMLPNLVNTWGMYIVVTYLFIQWLPKRRTFWRMFLYWFVWTGAMIIVEWIHVHAGHMTYNLWWRIYHSYIVDWILFWLFYEYYKVFRFEKLSEKK
jgi:hypothetical protein